MPAQNDDLTYFQERERQCLELAARAQDPGIQQIHRSFAQAYARRARAEADQDQVAA